MTKYCPKCSQHLPLEMFGKNKAHTNGIRNYCKSCHRLGCAQWSAKNRDKVLEHRRQYYQKNQQRVKERLQKQKHENPEVFKLWMHRGKLKKYGLTEHSYESLKKAQNGVCAICGKADKIKMLAVDHDHKSGQVRGLLCSKCNIGLGCFKDNIKLLVGAVDYLNSFYAQKAESA